jgi:hypothetical protein
MLTFQYNDIPIATPQKQQTKENEENENEEEQPLFLTPAVKKASQTGFLNVEDLLELASKSNSFNCVLHWKNDPILLFFSFLQNKRFTNKLPSSLRLRSSPIKRPSKKAFERSKFVSFLWISFKLIIDLSFLLSFLS